MVVMRLYTTHKRTTTTTNPTHTRAGQARRTTLGFKKLV